MSFPSKFGKYLLLERVNVGGMAEVFKAKTFGVAGFERILAIKRILPNLVEDDEFIRMFIDEARIAVQLNHANIVQIYELGKHGDHYYIAMEYVPSRDLRSLLDRLRASGQLMPIPQAAYITSKVAEGLDYAHRRKDAQGMPMNIIHRDVSPQNVLVGFEGEVKVIDFGIAKAANRASKTQAGVLKGKFGYMSPEQVRGLPIDRRSDIFAVGVLLYEMLTGERLFIGESDFSTLERVRNAEVIPPTSFNKKISPQLEQIVLKSLAREVEDRYQWASELAADLQSFVTDAAGAFNARRLSAAMKELYAAEVAAERAKLEEFLRINPDDLKEKGAPQQSSVLPLPQRAGAQPSPLAAQAKNKPAPQPAEDEGDFGEDKTFVIEASAAGMALGQPQTDPRLEKPGASKQATKPPQPVITASDPSSEDVSLYGGNQSSEDDEDDARTLVGAPAPVAPPGRVPPSPVSNPSTARPRAPAPPAPTRAPLPSTAAPPTLAATGSTPPAQAFPTKAPAGGGGGRGFDAVAAALAEDDADALEAISASSMGNSVAPAAVAPNAMPSPPFGVDVPGPQTPGPQTPRPQGSGSAESSAFGAPRPPDGGEANPFAMTPSTPVADVAPPPVPWKPLIAAVSASGALFLVAVVFFAVRLVGAGDGSPPELVLSPLGGAVPADLEVRIDEVVVAKSLPASVPLPDGEHQLAITGTGMVPVRRSVVGTGGTVRQPVAIVADGKTATPPSPPKTAPAVVGVPPPVVGGWRLSLAAVADDGAPVVGAEVLVNGVVLGTTPFEAELDPELSSVQLRVRKEGFSDAALDLKRNGRSAIGPATISLRSSGSSASASASATPTATTPTTPTPTTPTPSTTATTATTATTPAPTPPTPTTTVAVAGPRNPTPPAAPQAEPSKPAEPKPADPRPEPREPKDAQKPADPPKERAPRQVADIQLGTSPYADTTIDGRKYGSTPFFGPRKLTLPVGSHKVEFFDKVNNKKYRYQIKIKAPDPNNKVVIQFNKSDPPKVEGQVELKKLD